MLLKGIYTTFIDRLRIDKYKAHMMSFFGVLIEEDTKDVKIQGFILKNTWYRLYLPYIDEAGQIESFRKDQMHYIGVYYGTANLKKKIKELIKEDPEQFEKYYKAMEVLKFYERS